MYISIIWDLLNMFYRGDEVSLVKLGILLRASTRISCLWAKRIGIPPLKEASDLFVWANGIVDWDLTTWGVEMDLAWVFFSSLLLTGDIDNLVFLLLGFENGSSWYWNLPLEDALVLVLGMNHSNFDMEPNEFEAHNCQVLEGWASWRLEY